MRSKPLNRCPVMSLAPRSTALEDSNSSNRRRSITMALGSSVGISSILPPGKNSLSPVIVFMTVSDAEAMSTTRG
jgi:hypothetical protein